jgi:hypothetical protein
MVCARAIAVAILAGSLGCASAPSGTGMSAPRSQIITEQEIEANATIGTAYDLISKLRPNFLSSRGATSISGGVSPVQGQLPPTDASGPGPRGEFFPNVYLDGIKYGELSSLREIQSTQIGEVRFYQASEAERKFGPGNPAGVIAITTRR